MTVGGYAIAFKRNVTVLKSVMMAAQLCEHTEKQFIGQTVWQMNHLSIKPM